jgi:hypothetical protein
MSVCSFHLLLTNVIHLRFLETRLVSDALHAPANNDNKIRTKNGLARSNHGNLNTYVCRHIPLINNKKLLIIEVQ